VCWKDSVFAPDCRSGRADGGADDSCGTSCAAADELAAWTEARRQIKVTDVRVTEMQIVRWQYAVTGMMPVALASASLL
jgi:hypothetical protein